MSHIQLTPRSSNKWIPVLAALVVAGLALAWWSTQGSSPPPSAQAASAPVALEVASSAQPDVSPVAVQAMIEQQAVAAKEVERQPAVPPIKGQVKERPPFVSMMEWAMLKGVAQQHPNPDKELTRLVNFLRFTKQLELWQSMDASTDPAKRRAVAEPLLDDLPERVLQGDMDLAEARKTQGALLQDVVSDPQARSQRAEVERRRLDKAGEVAAATALAASAASAP